MSRCPCLNFTFICQWRLTPCCTAIASCDTHLKGRDWSPPSRSQCCANTVVSPFKVFPATTPARLRLLRRVQSTKFWLCSRDNYAWQLMGQSHHKLLDCVYYLPMTIGFIVSVSHHSALYKLRLWKKMGLAFLQAPQNPAPSPICRLPCDVATSHSTTGSARPDSQLHGRPCGWQ